MPNEEIHNSKRAKARWKLLAEALKKKTSCDLQNNQHSVRRFSGFSLFNVENISSESESNTWFRYSLKGNAGEKSLKIRPEMKNVLNSMKFGTPDKKKHAQHRVHRKCSGISLRAELEFVFKRCKGEIADNIAFPASVEYSGGSLEVVENVCYFGDMSSSGGGIHRIVVTRLLNSSTSAAELIGFNNTGNICIWPSEELLARYCIDHPELFIGKNVCELGGGMTSLAGLQVGLHTAAKYVLLTDGNNQSVQNLDVIVQHNINSFGKTTMLTRELIWCETDDEYQDLHHAFDVLICADCLFFVNVHTALINTIRSLLNQDGVCIILAPRRSGTLSKFIDLASAVFKIKVEERYDEVIWQLHEELKIKDDLYSPDLHYPILIKMWVRDSAT